MSLNLATLNARGLRDPSRCSRLLSELLNQSVNVAAVQETHFICVTDCRLLEADFVILAAYSSHSKVGVSQLVGHSLNADVNLVFADERGWLVVADVAIKSFEFWVSTVYVSNIAA